MRFLVVYQDYSRPAQELIDQLGVDDITILVVHKGERTAGDKILTMLRAHPHAPAAICQVHRKFSKSVRHLVDIQYAPKKFRPDDQQLRNWLRPPDAVQESYLSPRVALTRAIQTTPHLVAANGALDHANEIEKIRWRFANRSANLLARYANDDGVGPLRNWKQNHGVDFAANGHVVFKYRLTSNGDELKHGRSEWHLKEGDHTTRQGAARIYFGRVEFGGATRVVIFYVGPHARDGNHAVNVTWDPVPPNT